MMKWETVIGLEVHVQLATKSKLFSGSATQYGADANTQANVVDLAIPGVLPVLNREVLAKAVALAIAIDADINQRSTFARKNYFYPDLPKGYQITQHTAPIIRNGYIDIVLEEESKRISITHAHLEEDAGKSVHEDFQGKTGIDLNRAGTPLLEIVSAPDMRSAQEAVSYLKQLHSLVRYLEISDGNMQEGSFRCDANVSVRPMGQTTLGTRTEIKNVNSFRFVERAINYEVARQIELLEAGQHVVQETRLYDADKHETRAMRSKENVNDYRYFPDPDLLPVVITTEYINDIKATLPELPQQKRQRFCEQYGLHATEAGLLTQSQEIAHYFESIIEQQPQLAKLASNWILMELNGRLHRDSLTFSDNKISAAQLTTLLSRIADQTITAKVAKVVFDELWQGTGSDVDAIIAEKGLQQLSDNTALAAIINDIIISNPQQVADFRAGKEKLFSFFVGQVMRLTQGKANPAQVNQLLREKLQPDS